MTTPGSLIAQLRAEADIVDILHTPNDAIVRMESFGGRWTVEVITWIEGVRRQRYGRGETFVEAWRAMSGGAE